LLAVTVFVPAFPPRRQQLDRFQFLIRLPEPRDALFAPVVVHASASNANKNAEKKITNSSDYKK